MVRLLQVFLAFTFVLSLMALPSSALPQPFAAAPASAIDCSGSNELECVLTLESGYVTPGGQLLSSGGGSYACNAGTATFMNSASSLAEERVDFGREAIARSRSIFEDGALSFFLGSVNPLWAYWRQAKFDYAAVGTGIRSPTATAPYLGPQLDSSWFLGKRIMGGPWYNMIDAGQLPISEYSVSSVPFGTTTGITYRFDMIDNGDGTFSVPAQQAAGGYLSVNMRNTLARSFLSHAGGTASILSMASQYPHLINFYKADFGIPSDIIVFTNSGQVTVPLDQWGIRKFNRSQFLGTPQWAIRAYYDGHRASFTSYPQLQDTIDRVTAYQIAKLRAPYNANDKYAYLPAFFNDSTRSGRCNYLVVSAGPRFGPDESKWGSCPTYLLDRVGEYRGPITDPSGCYMAWARLEKIPPKISNQTARYVVDNMIKPMQFQGPGNATNGFTIGVSGPVYPLASTAAQRIPGGRTQNIGTDPFIPNLSINVRQLGVVAMLGNQQWSTNAARWNLTTATPTQAQYEAMYKLTLKAFDQTPLSVAQDPTNPLYSSVVWCLAPKATDSGATLRALLDGCQTNTGTYSGRVFEPRYRLTVRTYWTASYKAPILPKWRPFFNCATANLTGCPNVPTMETWNTSVNRARWGTSVPAFGSPRPPAYQPVWPQQFVAEDRAVGIYYEQTYLYVRVQQIQSR